MKCEFPRGPAWVVSVYDIDSVVFADNRSQAKWIALDSAKEAGYWHRGRPFPSVDAQRDPRFDHLHELRCGPRRAWCLSYALNILR